MSSIYDGVKNLRNNGILSNRSANRIMDMVHLHKCDWPEWDPDKLCRITKVAWCAYTSENEFEWLMKKETIHFVARAYPYLFNLQCFASVDNLVKFEEVLSTWHDWDEYNWECLRYRCTSILDPNNEFYELRHRTLDALISAYKYAESKGGLGFERVSPLLKPILSTLPYHALNAEDSDIAMIINLKYSA